ncbi:MAG: glutamate decarboxylase [Acidobacteria bacterium]|nr:MAG: glutamate decarboxylase [Acidobacteriota bacterium]
MLYEASSGRSDEALEINPLYARDATNEIPKWKLAESEVLPSTAAQIIRDELALDGSARLNLATFVSTWMEPEARALMADTFDKNMIDKDEYPQTAEIEMRCVNIISNLWHGSVREGEHATGCSTTGSSEASMLAGMALKWRWRAKMRKASKPADRPNMVMGINVQVCWEKFCRYWEVEPRFVPMEGDRFHIDPEAAAKLCDENTIGVVGVLGSTFDGSYEPIEELAEVLDRLESKTGLDIPIHVDAASGGFVAPFIQPELKWDFRLKRVCSINASGHKYGLVYPGIGWVVWRNSRFLPADLVFKVNYLGGEMPTFALNFSRPGNQVVGQYYNFIRLGFSGYRSVQQECQNVAMRLSSEIANLGPFTVLTDGSDLPVFIFALTNTGGNFTVFDLSERLRDRGWLVPAYTMPKHREDLAVLRVVVRNGFSHDMADMLLADLKRHLDHFAKLSAPLPSGNRGGFHH